MKQLHNMCPDQSEIKAHLLIDILNFPHTDGQRLLSVSSFSVIRFSDGVGVLGQTCQAVDGICGHRNNVTLFQGLYCATQDFSTICSSKTRGVNETSSTEGHNSMNGWYEEVRASKLNVYSKHVPPASLLSFSFMYRYKFRLISYRECNVNTLGGAIKQEEICIV